MRYTRSSVIAILVSALLAAAGGVTSAKPHKDWGVWFFGLCTFTLLAAPFIQRRTRRKKERVEFDEEAIRRYLPDGRMETIRWSELHEIAIVTTDEGPWVDDVFWLFLNADRTKGCAVSNDADGFSQLLSRIQALPGFDNQAVVVAMGSATNNRFLVWRAAAEQVGDAK